AKHFGRERKSELSGGRLRRSRLLKLSCSGRRNVSARNRRSEKRRSANAMSCLSRKFRSTAYKRRKRKRRSSKKPWKKKSGRNGLSSQHGPIWSASKDAIWHLWNVGGKPST